MPTDTGYRPRDPLRVCDICGVRYHFSELKPIGELRWACPDDAPGLTANQISRINARARPLTVKPVKWAKPVTQIPTYAAPEAANFNAIVSAVTASGGITAATVQATAWAAIYLADVVLQGKRPSTWIATAKATVKSACTALVALQTGGGVAPSTSTQDPRYGGFLVNGSYFAATAIAAGAAFVKAYQALGDPALLQAADRCAVFLRHLQCGDLQASQGTVYPAGGSPYRVGGVAVAVADSTGLQSQNFNTQDILALWFFALLVVVRSPAQVYGDGAATSFFTAGTAAPLSQMMNEMGAFASLGARLFSAGGAFATGLATKFGTAYTASIVGSGAQSSWTYPATVTAAAVCQAIRGVYEASGVNAQVSAMVQWLMAFTPNPANATPIQPQSVTLAGRTGTYDPTLCVASSLNATAPFIEATGTTYDWASEGVLAPVLNAMGMNLRTTKDTLAMPRRTSTRDVNLVFLGPQGQSGLSLQVTGSPSTQAAAQTAMIYREPPGMYPQVALY